MFLSCYVGVVQRFRGRGIATASLTAKIILTSSASVIPNGKTAVSIDMLRPLKCIKRRFAGLVKK